ncbi:MAG: hypothetical protein HXY36_03760 [Chloroflexi bacterium]|nr:hypothetical protein [Chloroflexota bacterium]
MGVKAECVIMEYVKQFEQRYRNDSSIYNQYLNAIQKINLNLISRGGVGNIIKPFLYKWGRMGRVLGQNKFKDWESKLAQQIQLNFGKLQNLAGQRFLGAALGKFKSDIEDCYESFKNVVGPIAAAKVLHLICPNFFPLWDNDIAKAVRDEFRGKGRNRAVQGLSGEDYYEFMQALQGSLKKHQQVISHLSQRYKKSDLKIMDEFLWWATHRPLSLLL